ncbi:MAG: AGE family epimerase/isomerase [Sphingomonadales bacterium]|nr:AGE family epimerase/isomerase [Sphingomonadales bacterium]
MSFRIHGTEFRDVEAAQNHARSWLFGRAAPLWSSEGVCPDGLFAERIALDGRRVELPRRFMVQARQIFSFITMGQLGWEGPWREIVTRVVDVLIDRGRREDGLFVHLFDPSGAVCDSRLDLYNHAFGLFALGHAATALDRPDLLAVASDVMDRLNADWRRPEGGFWEGEITPCPPYRQNPHMHMFEAGLALHRAGGGERWIELVRELGELHARRFREPRSGAVCEYFDRDWQRQPGANGAIVEPGHCLEWAWLFEMGLPEGEGLPLADGLSGFALEHGICPDRGVAINEVDLDGAIVDAGARLWPQTERLKCAVARYRRLGGEDRKLEILQAYSGLSAYLDTATPGTWYDRWEADGSWVAEAAPASSFYHIMGGISELLSCPS